MKVQHSLEKLSCSHETFYFTLKMKSQIVRNLVLEGKKSTHFCAEMAFEGVVWWGDYVKRGRTQHIRSRIQIHCEVSCRIWVCTSLEENREDSSALKQFKLRSWNDVNINFWLDVGFPWVLRCWCQETDTVLYWSRWMTGSSVINSRWHHDADCSGCFHWRLRCTLG